MDEFSDDKIDTSYMTDNTTPTFYEQEFINYINNLPLSLRNRYTSNIIAEILKIYTYEQFMWLSGNEKYRLLSGFNCSDNYDNESWEI